MLVLIFLVHYALGGDSPKQPRYDIGDVPSCPDEGYYWTQELQDLQLSQHPGVCHLCFCEEGRRAVCWEQEFDSCNDTHQHHVGRRSVIKNPKTFFYDGNYSIPNNSVEQEECSEPGRILNLDCPPADWCSGCTVCECIDSGKWTCRILQACSDATFKKNIVKRNLYRILTESREKNHTSSKSIFHRSKKDRMIKVKHEKEISIPEEVYTKNKDRIIIQHTKEILEQKEISSKKKEERRAERRNERIITVHETTTQKNNIKFKFNKKNGFHNHKNNKHNKAHNLKVNYTKDNKNNTLRKEMSQAKTLYVNTKTNKKMNKQQSKLQNKSLQETHKLSVRHISIHSEKHKARITKRHNSKTYLTSLLEKNNKVKQEKLFFKLAYCDDSKGRLARRKRDTEPEVTADDIVTLSNETDPDLYIAKPEFKSVPNESERKSTTHYFAYKLVDKKKDTKKTRAVTDLHFPFIDELENVISKLNEVDQLTVLEQQDKDTSNTDYLLDQFGKLHGAEDANSVAHLNRTKLNYTMTKKLTGKDVIRKLKMRSGFYKTSDQIVSKLNFTVYEDTELRQYISKVLNLVNNQGNGHLMLLNYKRLNALKFLRELLKYMFHKKNYNKSFKNDDKTMLDLLCNNFGPCLIKKEKTATIKSNANVLHMEIVKMLRIVKIIKSLLSHIEKPDSCSGKPEFNCDILTLTTVMKKDYEKGARTHEEKILINSIKQNTKSFIRCVEHFVAIFNHLLTVVTKHETMNKVDGIPDSTNSTKSLFKKLKRLISVYKLSENHFLKSIAAAAPDEKNTTKSPNTTKTDMSPAYTMNIMKKLKKLKNLAEAVITQNKQRTKRSLDFDIGALEYLLNFMEIVVKRTSPLEQAKDGIDLLLDTIEKSSYAPRPKKKKYLYPMSAPHRTTTIKPMFGEYKEDTFSNEMKSHLEDFSDEDENSYVPTQSKFVNNQRYTTPYPIKFLSSESDRQKGDYDTLPAVLDKKQFRKLKQAASRNKQPLLRGHDQLKPNYVPMRTTTVSLFKFPVEPDFSNNYIDELADGTNNTVNTTPILKTDLIHRSFKPVFNDKLNQRSEDINIDDDTYQKNSKEEEKEFYS